MKFKTIAVAAMLCLATISAPAVSKENVNNGVPLIFLKKHYVTNCFWHNEQVRLGGQEINTFIAGLGGEHDATARYTLEGDLREYEMFESTVGFKDGTVEGRGATFEVWVNGVKVASKGPLISGDSPTKIRANIKGASEVLLRIVPSKYNGTQSAIWGDPTLWKKYVDNDEETGVTVAGEGHNERTQINSFKGESEFKLPMPLYTGTHEFVVHYEYDKEREHVEYKLEHTNAHPQVGATFTKMTKEDNATTP